MGNADCLNKVYLMLEYVCAETTDTYLKPGPFMLENCSWNDGSDNI